MNGWAHVRTWFDRVRQLSPRVVLALGYAVFVVYSFPGYMSSDSVVQLLEARSLKFSDGHPPLMAGEWALLEKVVAGPVLMLLLQGALFLGGCYFVLRRVAPARRAAWLACAVLLFPPVLTTMAVIWKDSQMAAYLMAGTAALVQPRLRIRVLGLVLLVIACALRHNAFAAVVPLVFCLFEWRQGLRWWKRFAVLGVATVVMLGAAFIVTRLMTTNHVIITPMFQDIVGVMARTDDKTDEEWREILKGTPLAVSDHIQDRARALHEMWGAWHIVQGDERLFDQAQTKEQWDALEHVWKRLVFADPAAYLLAHWDMFAWLIGLGPDPAVPGPMWNVFMEDPPKTLLAIHHGAYYSRAQVVLARMFESLHWHTSLFSPYIYALLALALLAVCARDRLTVALFTSGLLYELSYFPFGPNPDYRYSHWMIATACVGVVVLYRKRREQT